MAKKQVIIVDGKEIVIRQIHEEDYFSLTDMAGEGGNDRIQNWMRNRDTVDFLATWEQIHNPEFNSVHMHRITEDAGRNRFLMSPKKWIKETGAIGIYSKAGRYGGTYAHKDIAYHFGMWLDSRFALLVIKEFDRLKEQEALKLNQQWSYSRFLSKINYSIQAKSIQDHLLPKLNNPKEEGFVYASEADLLNLALFGMTAKQWREAYPQAVKSGQNIRDVASIQELTVLANLESFNAQLIQNGANKEARFQALAGMARYQLDALFQEERLIDVDPAQQVSSPKLGEKGPE